MLLLDVERLEKSLFEFPEALEDSVSGAEIGGGVFGEEDQGIKDEV